MKNNEEIIGEDPETTYEKLAMMRKIWDDTFNSASPNDAVLQHMAKGRDLEGLREFFFKLKEGLQPKEESGIDLSDIALHWKTVDEIEGMQGENSCQIPNINIFKFAEEDVRRSDAEGVDMDVFSIVLSHRIKQEDGTHADAMMNVEGKLIKEDDQTAFNTTMVSKLAALQDQIMNEEICWNQMVIPVTEANNEWGPILLTDKDNSQMLAWLLVPAFVDDLRHLVKKHSKDEVDGRDTVELVVYPISKRVIIACNAYDHTSCLMMSRMSQDPGIAGNAWERLQCSMPMIVSSDTMRGSEDLDEDELLAMIIEGQLPVTYAPYQLRTSCLLAGEIAGGRGLIPPRLQWGSQNLLATGDSFISGNCSACSKPRKSLISCSKCWRTAYCNEMCLQQHLAKHDRACKMDQGSLQAWRGIVEDYRKEKKALDEGDQQEGCTKSVPLKKKVEEDNECEKGGCGCSNGNKKTDGSSDGMAAEIPVASNEPTKQKDENPAREDSKRTSSARAGDNKEKTSPEPVDAADEAQGFKIPVLKMH